MTESTNTSTPSLIADYVKKAQSLNDSTEVFALNVDSLAPWSFSKYKSLKKCPFQFFLKYILKLKIPENLLVQSDPLSANVGKAAHEILEAILLGKEVDESFSQIKAKYVQDTKLLSEDVWTERVGSLHFNISNFKERIDTFSRNTPIKKVLTELRMGVTREGKPTDFFSKNVFIRGVIDLVLILECLDAIIFDHKTGGGQGSIKNYEEQLDWYKFLIHFGVTKVVGAQTGIHFIGEGQVKMSSYSFAKDIENSLRNSIEMSLEGAIEILKDIGFFKHIRGSYCKWCEYDNLGCKSGALKPLELSTKKWIPIHTAKG